MKITGPPLKKLTSVCWLAVKVALIWLLANSGNIPFVYQNF